MSEDWLRRHQAADSIYALDATEKQRRMAGEAIQTCGWAPADFEDFFRGGLGLLVERLRREPPTREVLRERILSFAARERPHLPDTAHFRSDAQVVWVPPARCGWVDPRRILLKKPGEESFIHHKVDEMADFAFKLALAVRNDPARRARVLAEVFRHPTPEQTGRLHVESWETPLGGVYRVELNGNHRLAVFAALEVPCVLAEIRENGPQYTTRRPATVEHSQLVRTSVYRRLLHTYGVASIPQLGISDYNDITTEWPILLESPESAAASLAALEEMAGRRWEGAVGDLPRWWFDDPEFLDDAGTGLFGQLVSYRDSQPHGRQRSSLQRLLSWTSNKKKRRELGPMPTEFGELPNPAEKS